jgi:beta-galactosidase
VFRWYRELWRRGILVDFVHPQAELSDYRLLVAPAAVVLPQSARRSLARFVSEGGHLAVGYQSGVLDENLHVIPDGYLGELREVLGLRIEEFAPPAAPSMSGGGVTALAIDGLAAGPAQEWGEVVDPSTAEVRSRFVGGMLDGLPAITRNAHGSGAAWYVATAPDDLAAAVDAIIAPVLPDLPAAPPPDVEIVERGGFRFVLNHSDAEVRVDGAAVAPRGARVERPSGQE